LEVLVIDDGSLDNTVEMVARDYGREPRLRYLHQENRGVSAARNLGIKHAKGDYIAFLDSDDIWEPWKLELQVAAMQYVPEIGMVWTNMTAVGSDGAILSSSYLKTMYRAYRYFSQGELFSMSHSSEEVAPALARRVGPASLHVGEIFSKMIMGNMVHASTVLVRRRILEAIKGFNEVLKISGEDYDFHLRTCRECPVGFIDVSSIRYQVGLSDQLTHSSRSIHIARSFLRTIEPVIQHERSDRPAGKHDRHRKKNMVSPIKGVCFVN
jgi:glycosyltransferase involved in cell wall biosynthesis